ncbi:MAG: hypothetical protein JRI68_01815 [Deltaproteobacteria bacterium]|nr:hypothetical protein [Deltaproteobacteria bacterium]
MARLCWIGLVALALLGVGCDDETSDEGALGAACGSTECLPTEYCCDPACGLCVEQGVACTQTCE